jgi:hypothetical protein
MPEIYRLKMKAEQMGGRRTYTAAHSVILNKKRN